MSKIDKSREEVIKKIDMFNEVSFVSSINKIWFKLRNTRVVDIDPSKDSFFQIAFEYADSDLETKRVALEIGMKYKNKHLCDKCRGGIYGSNDYNEYYDEDNLYDSVKEARDFLDSLERLYNNGSNLGFYNGTEEDLVARNLPVHTIYDFYALISAGSTRKGRRVLRIDYK